MRKKIVAGNWKMNLTPTNGLELVEELKGEKLNSEVEVIVVPPATHLGTISAALEGSQIKLGSQNNHSEDFGAFTGEVSAPMLADLGVSYGIVGHSERRAYFHEKEDFLMLKVKSLLKHGLTPIYCCGESLEERKSGKHFDRVEQQLQVLWELSPEEFAQVVIAYEPVWAIGTGETASSSQAQEIHDFIRKQIQKHFGTLAEEISILYGGSCKPSNAEELFAQADVDGGLIGGASLNAKDFAAIINSF